MRISKQNKGFTLLEILLVIAAIGILASIVLVAINPNRQIEAARNAQRRSYINTIYKATEQYLIDTGSYPSSVNSNYKEICNTGTEQQVGGATDCSGKADLRVLVPDYIASIPPATSGEVYRVGINGNNKIAVYTIGENNQTIAINFAVTSYGIIDIDAFNYITAIEVADGQALEETVKVAINDFVVGAKADGIWDAIKASVIMAGARTLNGALVPLKGTAPTNFNFVSGDYNRKTGLVGNGSTKYLNSNRNQNADPQDNKHGFVYVTTAASGPAAYLGSLDGSYLILLRQADARLFLAANASASGIANEAPPAGNRTGSMGVSRNNSTNYQRRSASVTDSVALASLATTARPAYVYARNNAGTPDVFANARLAFYSIGESLDLALFDARVTQLITDLGNAIP